MSKSYITKPEPTGMKKPLAITVKKVTGAVEKGRKKIDSSSIMA